MNEGVISDMENRIKSLEIHDKMYPAFEAFDSKIPSKFEMLPGYRASLKRISKIISTLDEASFERQLTTTREGVLTLALSPSNNHPVSPGTSSSGKLTQLDPTENYAEKMTKTLADLVRIGSPHIIDPVINLIEEKRSPTGVYFKVQCCYCQVETFISVSVYISDGYLRVVTSNFMRHIEKKHEEPGKRLTDAKVIYKSRKLAFLNFKPN